MHSFERKLFPLSNGVSGKVVQRIGRELFDLKARGDIFLNHPVYPMFFNQGCLLFFSCSVTFFIGVRFAMLPTLFCRNRHDSKLYIIHTSDNTQHGRDSKFMGWQLATTHTSLGRAPLSRTNTLSDLSAMRIPCFGVARILLGTLQQLGRCVQLYIPTLACVICSQARPSPGFQQLGQLACSTSGGPGAGINHSPGFSSCLPPSRHEHTSTDHTAVAPAVGICVRHCRQPLSLPACGQGVNPSGRTAVSKTRGDFRPGPITG